LSNSKYHATTAITRGVYQYLAFRLKFRIISIPTFSGNLVVAIFSVAVLPTGFMESQLYFNWKCRAAQFHPVVIVVSSLNAIDQIDAKEKKNHKNVSRKTYSFLKVNYGSL